ncbi:MAG: PQQ-dependent sugar dehydrogenase [Pseudanabaenaceae cyanobacterium]
MPVHKLTLGLLVVLLVSCARIDVAPSSQTEPSAPKKPKPEVLITGLEHPWGMAWLPDGRMLITERAGRIRIVRNGVLDPRPVAGLPPIFVQGQGGLLDIAVHPRFVENSLIYFTYAAGTPTANHTRVARAVFRNDRLEHVEDIFQVGQLKSGAQHFGSRLLWLPDGTLLVTIGDGGNPPITLDGALIRLQAQNKTSHLGKIIRIRDDGSIPPDNPFRKDPQADPRLYTYGHRNIQGIDRDPRTGQIWASEHGAREGDELNLIRAGNNYGWPVVTHSREYFGPEITTERSRPGMADPVLVWEGTVAPSGLAIHQGKIYAGGLVSQDIREIEVDAQERVVRQRSIPIGRRVRDVRSRDGWLYVLTDYANGELLRLRPESL